MKIPNSSKPCQGGMAVIVLLVILSIMLLYIMAGIRSLTSLQRELQITEQHQTKRLAALSTNRTAATNAPPTIIPPTAQPAN